MAEEPHIGTVAGCSTAGPATPWILLGGLVVPALARRRRKP